MADRPFNRLCALLALALLAGRCLYGLIAVPGFEDFGQYYMGGLVARAGAWESLYPVPAEGSTKNAGWRDGSSMKPGYESLARVSGVGDVNRFVLPPPMAIVFAPLALLPYDEAAWLWAGLMILAGWGTALLAGRIYAEAAGRSSKIEGALCLLVAASPLMKRAIGTSQLSPLVGLCAGAAILAFVRRRDFAAAAAMTAGALAKVAPIALLFLGLLPGRRRLILHASLVAASILLLTLPFTGIDPWIEFAVEIAPTLTRSSAWRGNQSLAGFLLRISDAAELSGAALLALAAGRLALGAVILALLWRARRAAAVSAGTAAAGGAALLISFLVTSPLFWEHYFVYLCPLWGWAAWEGTLSRPRAAVAWTAMALMWWPAAIEMRLGLREPLLSHMLMAALLMLSLACLSLWQAGRASPDPSSRPGLPS